MRHWADRRVVARCAVVCLVLGVHGAFILLLSQIRHPGLRRPHDENYLIWLRLQRPRDLPAPSPTPARENVRESAHASPPASAPAMTPTPSTAAPRQIDWAGAAAAEAKRAAQGGDGTGYRNLGPRKPGEPGEEAAPPTIFEAPKHQLGDEGVDPFGDPIVWLTEHCYKELPRLITTARDLPVPRPLSPFKCVWGVGKREPRGDLFESLKRDRPLPEPKAGSLSELPERTPAQSSAPARIEPTVPVP